MILCNTVQEIQIHHISPIDGVVLGMAWKVSASNTTKLCSLKNQEFFSVLCIYWF